MFLFPNNPFQRNVLQATFAGPARLVTFTARDKNNSSNNDQFFVPSPSSPLSAPPPKCTLVDPRCQSGPSECPVLKKEQTCSSVFICVTLSSRGCHASYPRALPSRLIADSTHSSHLVKDVECAVLDPVPSLQKKSCPLAFWGPHPKLRSQPCTPSPPPSGVISTRILCKFVIRSF